MMQKTQQTLPIIPWMGGKRRQGQRQDAQPLLAKHHRPRNAGGLPPLGEDRYAPLCQARTGAAEA